MACVRGPDGEWVEVRRPEPVAESPATSSTSTVPSTVSPPRECPSQYHNTAIQCLCHPPITLSSSSSPSTTKIKLMSGTKFSTMSLIVGGEYPLVLHNDVIVDVPTNVAFMRMTCSDLFATGASDGKILSSFNGELRLPKGTPYRGCPGTVHQIGVDQLVYIDRNSIFVIPAGVVFHRGPEDETFVRDTVVQFA